MSSCLCSWFLLKTSYSLSDHLLKIVEEKVGDVMSEIWVHNTLCAVNPVQDCQRNGLLIFILYFLTFLPLLRALHHLGNSQPQVCARAGVQARFRQGGSNCQEWRWAEVCQLLILGCWRISCPRLILSISYIAHSPRWCNVRKQFETLIT